MTRREKYNLCGQQCMASLHFLFLSGFFLSHTVPSLSSFKSLPQFFLPMRCSLIFQNGIKASPYYLSSFFFFFLHSSQSHLTYCTFIFKPQTHLQPPAEYFYINIHFKFKYAIFSLLIIFKIISSQPCVPMAPPIT